MFSRHVGIAFVLQAVVLAVAFEPAILADPVRALPTPAVSVEIQPLDLATLQIADFGDVDPAR